MHTRTAILSNSCGRARRFRVRAALCILAGLTTTFLDARCLGQQSSAPTCPNTNALNALASAPFDAPVWRRVLRGLRLPRAGRRGDLRCRATTLEMHRTWENGAGGECASLVVRARQACSDPMVSNCGDTEHDVLYARIGADSRGQPRILERLEVARSGRTPVDTLTGANLLRAMPLDDGEPVSIVSDADGRLRPWQLADARLPDLDGDGWSEAFVEFGGSRECAMQTELCENLCCAYTREAVIMSTATGRILGGPVSYSGMSDFGDFRAIARRVDAALAALEDEAFECPVNASITVLGVPGAFALPGSPRPGSSQINFHAPRVTYQCPHFASDGFFGWGSGLQCAPIAHMGEASFTVARLETWSAATFTSRVDVREAWPAVATHPVAATGCNGMFTSGVPIIRGNLSEHIPGLNVLALGATGLAVVRPDGSIVCSLPSDQHPGRVTLAMENLTPGVYEIFGLSRTVQTGSGNMHIGISASGQVMEEHIYSGTSAFCPPSTFGPCCSSVPDRQGCPRQG